MELAENEAAAAAWKHPADLIDQEAQEQLVMKLAHALTPVMQFIAKGRLGGTMAHRSWVWLHETRLDMIGAESIEDYARRAGLSAPRIHELVREFRRMIPAYRSSSQRSETACAKMRAAARKRVAKPAAGGVANSAAPEVMGTHAPQSTDANRERCAPACGHHGPGGKESFSAPLPPAGSATR